MPGGALAKEGRVDGETGPRPASPTTMARYCFAMRPRSMSMQKWRAAALVFAMRISAARLAVEPVDDRDLPAVRQLEGQ